VGVKDQNYIEISQVVGKGKIFGPFSVWQFILFAAILVLIYILYTLKFDLFKSALVGMWLLASMTLLTGDRPDRFVRRLLGKPRRWRRGFRPAQPLLLDSIRHDRK